MSRVQTVEMTYVYCETFGNLEMDRQTSGEQESVCGAHPVGANVLWPDVKQLACEGDHLYLVLRLR